MTHSKQVASEGEGITLLFSTAPCYGAFSLVRRDARAVCVLSCAEVWRILSCCGDVCAWIVEQSVAPKYDVRCDGGRNVLYCGQERGFYFEIALVPS